MVKFRLRWKKKKESKPKPTFEDSIKAKAKLDLLEKRYKIIRELIIGKSKDKELGTSNVLKAQLIATQGFGEVGDKNKPSNEAVEGWQELLEMATLDELEYGLENDIDKVNTTLLFGALANLYNRSLRREHTDVQVVTIPPEMFMPGWALRASRESSLET